MVSCDEINATGRGQLVEWLGRPACVDSCPVIQIPGDENYIRLLSKNLRNHAPQETAVAHVSQMDVTDERGPAPAPLCRQIGEAHCCPRNPSPACVENAGKPNYR